ncbi:MAG: helix-turn-helix transcriptional regulator [Oscillospiraceae bacterium]
MLYDNIRNLREDGNLKQADVAKILNMAQNTYSQYETGKIEWTAPVLIRLADFYDVSVDYLLNRTDNPKLNRK